MVTVQIHRPGTIDWLGLSTPDREGSARFYADLLDWDITRYETGAGPYLTGEVRGRDAAGILQPQPTIGDMALPATWTISVRVDDLDESLVLLADLGGLIIQRPFEIPEIGLAAVVADPTGAVFSLAAFHPDFGLGVRDEPGALVWCDLLTRDPVTAIAFYSSLFGWDAAGEAAVEYRMLAIDGRQFAGMTSPATVSSSRWLPFFGVGDCVRSMRRARELGGIVHQERLTPVGRSALVEDPQGARFGILEGGA